MTTFQRRARRLLLEQMRANGGIATIEPHGRNLDLQTHYERMVADGVAEELPRPNGVGPRTFRLIQK